MNSEDSPHLVHHLPMDFESKVLPQDGFEHSRVGQTIVPCAESGLRREGHEQVAASGAQNGFTAHFMELRSGRSS
jgi:hypothetical protein